MTEYPSDWMPSASLQAIRDRATLYQHIRQFFSQRDVLEIDVPVLARCAVTDPFIDSIQVDCCGAIGYLQSSPEYFMKRLLAAGSGAIFSLGKVFRNGEVGRRHNPEFTMLEWYRPGWDEQRLMDEVEDLLTGLLSFSTVQRLSYRAVFQHYLGVDPHQCDIETLQQLARQYGEMAFDDDNRDTWLDILMTHAIEPQLGEGLVFIYDFPASQCALAKVITDDYGQPVAKRFEAYIQGMELANGYWELTDEAEQASRFAKDLDRRELLALAPVPTDQRLLAALHSGMPESAGVALGVDRLLMLMVSATSLNEVLAFPFPRV